MSEDGEKKPVAFSDLPGRKILVGITYYDADGGFESQQQLHGTVTSADEKGILIALEGERAGQTWNMPPDASAIEVAGLGVYTLRETGEEITDPDYLATWACNRQRDH